VSVSRPTIALQRTVESLFVYRLSPLAAAECNRSRKFDIWRYVNGNGECGTTQESKDWVDEHSNWDCPICDGSYSQKGGKTIDHKLPRSQYPWLSMKFKNLWVMCQTCNQEKGEMHWYEYEHYIFVRYPDLYLAVKAARPSHLLQSLNDSGASLFHLIS